jgi:hypothetical protein
MILLNLCLQYVVPCTSELAVLACSCFLSSIVPVTECCIWALNHVAVGLCKWYLIPCTDLFPVVYLSLIMVSLLHHILHSFHLTSITMVLDQGMLLRERESSLH